MHLPCIDGDMLVVHGREVGEDIPSGNRCIHMRIVDPGHRGYSRLSLRC